MVWHISRQVRYSRGPASAGYCPPHWQPLPPQEPFAQNQRVVAPHKDQNINCSSTPRYIFFMFVAPANVAAIRSSRDQKKKKKPAGNLLSLLSLIFTAPIPISTIVSLQVGSLRSFSSLLKLEHTHTHTKIKRIEAIHHRWTKRHYSQGIFYVIFSVFCFYFSLFSMRLFKMDSKG